MFSLSFVVFFSYQDANIGSLYFVDKHSLNNIVYYQPTLVEGTWYNHSEKSYPKHVMNKKSNRAKHYTWVFSGIGTAIFIALNEYFKTPNAEIFAPIAIGFAVITAYIALGGIISFLKRKDFGAYIKSKVKEIFYLFLEEKKTYIKSTDRYNAFYVHEKLLTITTQISNFTCFNQGIYADYSFMSGRYHKNMKDELNRKERDLTTLKNHCIDLKNHLHGNFKKICEENFSKHIKYFFIGRSQYDVRMTVKGCSRDDKIVDLFRLHYEYATAYSPGENKGFQHVQNRGSYYLCNNIPQVAADDDYFNPRLINEKARTYVKDIQENGIAQDDLDRWINCWIPNKKGDEIVDPSPESCYKSTLIIPITLINNEGLSEAFRNHFKIPRAPRSPDGIARAVYGLLCFDHREANFFIKEIDVKIGYIIADILSLYLVDLLNYMDYSDTFNDTKNLLPDIKEMFD